MKVLMLGWEFPPHVSGGLGTACAGIARGLSTRDVEVLFVLPRAAGERTARGARVLGAEHPAAPHDPGAGLELRPVASALGPYQTARSYASGPRSLLDSGGVYAGDLFAEVARYAGVVGELAGREACDVVHAHDWMAYAAGAAAARAASRPWIAHVHATEDDRCAERPDERITEAEYEGVRAADRVVCVSRYTAEHVHRRYGVEHARLRVVHNAAEPRPRPLGQRARRAPRGGPTVLFLGRVTSQKGPAHFLEAAARVHAVRPDVRFVVAGSGELLPRTIERTAELGLARRVRFTGFLGPADVERAFDLADLFVLTSLSEPFGIAPLEALERGVPVILPRRSGVAEVVPSAPRVDPWDTDALAGEMLRLLSSSRLRRRLCARARAELAGVTWEASGARLAAIYDEVAP